HFCQLIERLEFAVVRDTAHRDRLVPLLDDDRARAVLVARGFLRRGIAIFARFASYPGRAGSDVDLDMTFAVASGRYVRWRRQYIRGGGLRFLRAGRRRLVGKRDKEC